MPGKQGVCSPSYTTQSPEYATFTKDGRLYALPPTFLHPGGNQVLLEHQGEDISDLFKGINGGHAHSFGAQRLLETFCCVQRIEDSKGASSSGQAVGHASQRTLLSVPEPEDIDVTQPILFKVGQMGAKYSRWVYTPVPGQPRFFVSSTLEALTKCPWWVVPMVWLPVIAALLLRVFMGSALQRWVAACLVASGVLLWQALEYSIHRFLFHAEPHGYWPITLHFAFHGCHHKFPMDGERLVFPPLPAAALAAVIYCLIRLPLPKDQALAVFCGVLIGYLAYDCLHYAMHHAELPGALLARVKTVHMGHHYVDQHASFGISCDVMDRLLGTRPRQQALLASAAAKAR